MNNTENIKEIEKVKIFSEKVAKIKSELSKDVVGQSEIIDNVPSSL